MNLLEFSGGSECELAMHLRLRPGSTVRASGMAGLGTSTERFVDDGLDGARTTAAFGAAAEAAINLLGITRKGFRGVDGVADIVVAEDVAGTNNHGNGTALGDVEPSVFYMGTGCKRKNRLFK